MTKDTLVYYTPKQVLLLLAVSLALSFAFIKLAFKLTTSTEDAMVLSILFVTTLLVFEGWGENIGTARFKRQQEQQKRSIAND
jgi:hypothetical protein